MLDKEAVEKIVEKILLDLEIEISSETYFYDGKNVDKKTLITFKKKEQ